MSSNELHPKNSVSFTLSQHRETGNPLSLSPTDIGTIVEHGQCPRYTKMQGDSRFSNLLFDTDSESDETAPDEEAAEDNEGVAHLKGSMEILSKEGNEFEESIYEQLSEQLYVDEFYNLESEDGIGNELLVDPLVTNSPPEALEHMKNTIEQLSYGDDMIIYGQFPVQNFIGKFSVAGLADLVCLIPTENGIELVVFDIKASWNEKVSQQLQASTYTHILRSQLSEFENLTINAGIIHKENYDFIEECVLVDDFAESYPRFSVSSREDDIERLLAETGMIYENITRDIDSPVYSGQEAFDVLSEIPYQIDKHCENCKFRDACFKQALESLDISLLGISQGERNALRSYQIKTLTDLSDMVKKVGNDFVVKEEYNDRITNLQQNHGVQDVKEMAIKATQVYNKIDPSLQSRLERKNWTPKTLPNEDNWDEDRAIKVFLNVQYDYITNTIIQLNARISPSNPSDDSEIKEITKLIPDIPFNHEENRVDIERTQECEQTLLKNFTQELFSSVEELSENIFGGTGYIHFYTYGQYEQEVLTESTSRHKNADPSISALYELLGVRDQENAGQEMWSTLESELDWMYYVDQLSTSLPAMFKHFVDLKNNPGKFGTYKFEYNGQTYNLDQCFSEQFFDYQTAYEFNIDQTNITLSLQDSSRFSNSSDDDNMISNESFSGANLPLEYYWGLSKYNLEPYLENRSDDSESEIDSTLIPYLYEATHNNSARLSEDHVSAMGVWIVRALDQIESSLTEYANSHNDVRAVNKTSLDLQHISSFSASSGSFADALMDYTKMEFVSKKNELLSEYEKTVEQRIKQGKSIPVKVTKIEGEDGRYADLKFHCKFAYSEFAFDDMSFIKSSLKHEVGDYLNATHLEFTGGSAKTVTAFHENKRYSAGPEDIINSPQVIVQELDQMRDEVVLSYSKNHYGDDTTLSERSFTLSEAEYYNQEELQPGDYLLLDEQLSTYHFEKDTEALGELSHHNPLYERINKLLHGLQVNVKTTYDKVGIDDFLSQLEDTAQEEDGVNYPNPEQEEFIKDTAPISLLQGPPGTGKTSGSLAPAILARAESHVSSDGYGSNFTGGITGPSNKAIDEVMNKTYELAESMGVNVDITRILSSSHEPETRKDDITYLESGPEFKTLIESLQDSEQQQLSAKLIFGTAGKIKHALTQNDNTVKTTDRFFDLLVVDEASMMTLPKFFTPGPFVKRSAQIMISGDQRQMAPVQTHEWEEETRPSIQKYVPYLSTLNYLLFIRGEEIDSIGFPDEHISQPNADIPLHQLEKTYRCHTTIADFLQEWVYAKDGLNYRSDITDTIDIDTTKDTNGVSAVLGDAPFVVITHSDTQSQESNLVETNIMKSITDSLKRNSWSGTKGVVTPHSSQKGLVKSKDVAQETDTVERYQGGERDLIMVSSTVSDPSFIRKEDDFLLNPNRINVAISRMKQKLIIVVPESVFEHIPDDIDVYDKSMIWNGLYDFVIDSDNPDWSGSLQEFVGQTDGIRDDVNVTVHTR